MEKVTKEIEIQHTEYSPGPKDGLVDFDTFRVVQDIRATLPRRDFNYDTITFSPEHLHQGIIAVAITELLGSFRDGNIPTLTVSTEAIGVLEAIGIPYRKETATDNLIFAEESFRREQTELLPTGD